MTREQRRLAAIVCADVVGYSRLIGADEAGTLARLRALRQELVDPTLAGLGGRIVKTTGDGLLLEFGSVVDAVRGAVAVQQAMARRDTALPEDRRMALRIGIHMGDIVIDGDDILGDGVNVAARLEALAEPGGVCVSGRVQEDLAGKLDLDLRDGGEQALKNIARPVRVWRWSPADTAATPAIGTMRPSGDEPLALPDKPSIAVLPFTNMSGDPEQEYFVDGLVEDIITALSRIRSLFVIARNSSFIYKGRAVDVREVARALGVRYVLEGSVRKSGNRLRITGQLVEGESGSHVWADRFDATVDDVFDLQDRVTAAVAGAIEPSLTQAEIRRANRKPTDSLQAYDWLLRAIGEQGFFVRESLDRAITMVRRAIALDANYAQAHAFLASWTMRRWLYDWMADEAAETTEAMALAYRAVKLGPDDPVVLTEAAFALAHLKGDIETAIAWLDRAIALNPNSAWGYGRGAIVRNFAGEYVTAADHADRASRLSPFDPLCHTFSKARGDSHLFRRQLGEAIVWLRRSAQEYAIHAPTFLHLGAALALNGEIEEGRLAIRRLLELRPRSSQSRQRARSPFREEDFEYVLEGARLAGLPE